MDMPMKPALFIATVMVSLGTASSVLAACDDPAGPNVNWSDCYLGWADLTGTDLRGAVLRRTNLMGADLFGANLTGADLTGATWTDGRTCALGSIGACIQCIDGVCF